MSKHKKILIIDDEAYIRRVLELKLKNRGYHVLTAANGEEGLAAIEGQQPDAVISDIMMPKLDGKTLCQKTKSIKKKRPFLTIIVTARINPEEREWISQMTDTIFMEKPFSLNKIVDAIAKYFEGQE